MSSDITIQVENVSKVYPIFKKPQDRLKQMIWRKRRTYYETFWALRDINLTVYKGETLGILGRNGSGKSTLLQIIAGTLRPTAGSVKTNGRIAALLELGAGFNPEFTGAENVILSGAILGISEAEMKKRYDAILDFADIGTFIDQPVKTYSSGMFARLAFAVASSVSPDILIVDEILAVGDAKFQARCFSRLAELKAAGTTIILVTHSPEQVIQHCTRAILLNNGSLLAEGLPKDVVNVYLDLLFGKSDAKQKKITEEIEKAENSLVTEDPFKIFKEDSSTTDLFSTRKGYNQYEYRWGDKSAAILDYFVTFNGVEYPNSYKSRGKFKLLTKCIFYKKPLRPVFGFAIKTRDGLTLYNTNSELQSLNIDSIEVNQPIFVSFEADLNLAPNDYFLSVGLADLGSGTDVPLDRRYDSIHINVIDNITYYGHVDLEVKIALA
ncbi:MAG: ABC transporter ATP-binding protein [Bdellovibrionota bacterium]|jgi:lipopolysaccharide transport system ATP-binding protein